MVLAKQILGYNSSSFQITSWGQNLQMMFLFIFPHFFKPIETPISKIATTLVIMFFEIKGVHIDQISIHVDHTTLCKRCHNYRKRINQFER